ncbi:suppressor of fused domain protein [Corynebacterium timonense]|uniref:Suppressor of fused protein (SUFU) n=1 Tax=Corynebacterium timonense TaxID=441500 RepID=A0A1H1QQ22_9CORY|nr:suppressor of fused domain protein [Corynebacterium timonense]SDS25447.1 Suppressor of fused protein (SUFU) [Corynebacterium timonense]
MNLFGSGFGSGIRRGRVHARLRPRLGGDALLRALDAASGAAEPVAFPGPAGELDAPAVLAYPCRTPVPHLLYTTFGVSRVRSNVPVAGLQTELSLRTAPSEGTPPRWPAEILFALARHIHTRDRPIEPGHYMQAPGIAGDGPRGFSFVADPVLGDVETVTGTVRYTYAVGLTARDLEDALAWNPLKFTGVLGDFIPLGLTDPARASLRDNPEARRRVEDATAAEGSSIGAVEVTFLDVEPGRIDLDPAGAAALLRAARGRLAFSRPFALVRAAGPDTWVRFAPDAVTSCAGGVSEVAAPPRLAAELLATFDTSPGVYRLRTVPLLIHVIDPRS